MLRDSSTQDDTRATSAAHDTFRPVHRTNVRGLCFVSIGSDRIGSSGNAMPCHAMQCHPNHSRNTGETGRLQAKETLTQRYSRQSNGNRCIEDNPTSLTFAIISNN
eukprot:jgi/Psemu1/11354/gm1.11354_g